MPRSTISRWAATRGVQFIFLLELRFRPSFYSGSIGSRSDGLITRDERRSLMFSEKEIAYLKSQRLARIATTSEDMQPDVAPVGFDFDGTYFYVGGINLPTTLKYKNVQKNPKVSLVIDDLESTSLGNRVALSFMGSLT